jgi:low temperature requirement protein LtrA
MPSGVETRHKVTWLELFYDLVYVATIIQLANVLSREITWGGVLSFVALFLPVWWSWMGVTFYANRFLSDDLWHRSLILIQTFAVAALAINVPTAFTASISGFALAYVGIRLILVLLYLRVPPEPVASSRLAQHYARGFFVSALIWLVAVFVPMPLRYGLWFAGMAVDFLVPLNPATRRLAGQVPPAPDHIAERFALFTLIVLGESYVKVVSSLAGASLGWGTVVFGALGLVVAGSIWWLYFDHIPEASLRPGRGFTWVYAHLPLAIAITALAVAVNKIVLLGPGEPLGAAYRWLFCGAVAACLATIALLSSVTALRSGQLSRAQLIAALGVLLVAFVGGALPPIILVALVAALCAAPVALSWRATHAIADLRPAPDRR